MVRPFTNYFSFILNYNNIKVVNFSLVLENCKEIQKMRQTDREILERVKEKDIWRDRERGG